jgi:hypothetical protein
VLVPVVVVLVWTARAHRAAVRSLTRNSPAASRTESPAAIAARPAAATSSGVPPAGRCGTRRARPRDRDRRVFSRRRSCSVIPPAIPSGSASSAHDKHSDRTGHPAHTAFASDT